MIFLTNDVVYLVIYFYEFIINFYFAFLCSDVKFPKQVMPMCILSPTFALKSAGKMVIVELDFVHLSNYLNQGKGQLEWHYLSL